MTCRPCGTISGSSLARIVADKHGSESRESLQSLEPRVRESLRCGWVESLAATPRLRWVIAAHATSRAAVLPVDPSLFLGAVGRLGSFGLVHVGVSLSDPVMASKRRVLIAIPTIGVLRMNRQGVFRVRVWTPGRSSVQT
jgi:hypothetical protein